MLYKIFPFSDSGGISSKQKYLAVNRAKWCKPLTLIAKISLKRYIVLNQEAQAKWSKETLFNTHVWLEMLYTYIFQL